MSCLGERLTALVDGELGHEERDRVLAHLAGCAQCRAEVAWLRRIKGRLRGLSELPATDGTDGTGDLPTPDFLNRLRSLPAAAAEPSAPAGPPPGGAPSPRRLRPSTRPVRPAPAGRPRDNRPAGHVAVQVSARRRVLAVGAATLVLGLGTASYIAGGSRDAPTVTPAFDRFAVEHALTSGDAPMTDPLTDPVLQVQASPGP